MELMFWKHKIYIFILCVLILAQSLHAKSFIDSIKQFLSFKVPDDLLSYVNDGIVGKLTVKDMRFYLPNKVELDDVALLDEHGARVIHVKQIKLAVSLFSLLTKTIRITDVTIDSPFFHYTIIDHISNIVSLFASPPDMVTKKPQSKSKFQLAIDNLRVENGRYEMYHDSGVTISADGVMADGSFWLKDEKFGLSLGEVEVKHGSILTGGMTLPISNLSAKNLWISEEKVATENLGFLYEHAKVVGKGAVFIENEHYDVHASIAAPMGTYPTGLSKPPFVVPAFDAQVHMLGPLSEPEFVADISHSATTLRGLKIRDGKAHVQFSQYQVVVNSSTIHVGDQGEVKSTGDVDLLHETYNFNSSYKNIAVDELSRFIGLNKATRGRINGEGSFAGSFSSDQQNLLIDAEGAISHGAFEQFVMPNISHFAVRTDIIFDKSIKVRHAQLADSHGLRLKLNGETNWETTELLFSFDALLPELTRYYALGKKSDAVAGLMAKGSIAAHRGVVHLKASTSARAINFARLKASNVAANVELLDDKLTLHKVSAELYEGRLKAEIALEDVFKEKRIAADIILDGIDLASLDPNLISISLAGKLSAALNLAGKLKDPALKFASEIDDLAIEDAQIRNSRIEGEYVKQKLEITTLLATVSAGSFESSNLSIDFQSGELGGDLRAINVSIGPVLSRYVNQIEGELNGTFHLGGTIDSPTLMAPLTMKGLQAYGVKFGQGVVALRLAKEPLIGLPLVKDLVVSLSANLTEANSTTSARFAYAIHKKTINLDVNLERLVLNTQSLLGSNQGLGVVGNVSGSFTARGPVTSPSFTANLVADEYSFFDPKLRKEVLANAKSRGPAQILAKSAHGKLDLSVCASLLEHTEKRECTDESSLMIRLSGPFALKQFSLDVHGSLDYAHLEDVIVPLRNELITVNSAMRVSGQIAKKPGSDISYNLRLALNRLVASLPNVPSIRLLEPITVTINDGQIKLKNEAILAFSPGQLKISGSMAKAKNDIEMHGTLPLMVTRYFTPLIQRGDGLARGDIAISGANDALILQGEIAFEPGASLTLRRWLDPIEIKEGKISFKKTSSTSFMTTFDNIRLAVGDGKMSIDGSIEKGAVDAQSKTTFDLDLQGSNINVHDGLDFVEADFKISTKFLSENESVAEGEIAITDGSVERHFDLRNFVAQAQSRAKPSVVKFLDALNTQIAINIGVRQFHVSARMLSLELEAMLRGQLKVSGPISSPKFTGALSITEGAIIFPSLTFPLLETQIELDETSPKTFDPKIDIVAMQELEVEDFPPPLIRENTTVELSLKGDLDRLNFDLRPLRGDMRLSKLKIFFLLLSPRSLAGSGEEQVDLKQGAQNAAVAFSGEVFLRPFTNELQELLASRTKTRIQFGSALEAGGIGLRLNWKLGPRIELTGSYLIRSDEARRSRSEFFAESYPLGDIKLKLLLFDHRPLGPLTLEGSFGSMRHFDGGNEPRGVIRVKYRVLSQ